MGFLHFITKTINAKKMKIENIKEFTKRTKKVKVRYIDSTKGIPNYGEKLR